MTDIFHLLVQPPNVCNRRHGNQVGVPTWVQRYKYLSRYLIVCWCALARSWIRNQVSRTPPGSSNAGCRHPKQLWKSIINAWPRNSSVWIPKLQIAYQNVKFKSILRINRSKGVQLKSAEKFKFHVQVAIWVIPMYQLFWIKISFFSPWQHRGNWGTILLCEVQINLIWRV